MGKKKKKLKSGDKLKPVFEKVGESRTMKSKIEDSKGKKHNAKYEQFTEKMPDNKHLIKFAPKFYYCPDNNMILEVVLSVQYTWEQFFDQTAKQAVSADKVIKEGHAFKEKMNEARVRALEVARKEADEEEENE